MAEHNDLGKWGEQLARDLLIAKGYGIIETNWRSCNLELDIIAQKGCRVVFIEVKTRSDDYVDPLQAIDRKRINHLVRAARSYIEAYDLKLEYQFDIITVVGHPASNEKPKIEHIEDAFLPPLRSYR